MAKKILIVDDDLVVLRLIESILRKANYEVIKATDGLDALNLIKKKSPDLVVLDVMVPEINGYDICYQLRFNPDFEKIPIVLVTERNRELGPEIGKHVNIEHVPKPVDHKLLLDKIKILLS